MNTWEIVFWLLIACIFYSYIGYGLLVIVWAKCKIKLQKSNKNLEIDFEPTVTLLIAAYNEESSLAKKLENSLTLDYPRDKLQIMVITDGSDDASVNIPKRYPDVVHLHDPVRRGKTAAINRAMPFVETDIVVFSDANTSLPASAIRIMVACFRDPAVGCVSGEKRVVSGRTSKAASAGESTYWSYESRIKAAESKVYSCVGAAGELYAIRTALYEPTPEDTIVDDFVISMRIAMRGYRIRYAPTAYAIETGSASIRDEGKRKKRIAAGNMQVLLRMPQLLNPFHHGMLSFFYISHKFLRSFLVPYCFLAIFVLSIVLVPHRPPFYAVLFMLQCLYYLAAWCGYRLRDRQLRVKLLFVPFYVVFMNYCTLVGPWLYLCGRQSVLWDKARRLSDG